MIAYHAVLSDFADLNSDGKLHTDLKALRMIPPRCSAKQPVELLHRDIFKNQGYRNEIRSTMLDDETTVMESIIKERHGSEISIPRTHHKVPSFNFSIN